MRRRRRSRSRFGPTALPVSPVVLFGGGALLVLAAFVFFMMRADQLAPEPQLMRIELPEAFKQ